ncbi:MAG: UDP-glucose/GDP-mannose dehydrogenase family protein [Syntrophales bacterium]|jgi:UDPglucose 6-dehydrogenase|nr:UDP-glucose/GDP-mannose dehydrogenase family protein [Syntrophales bacterium]
MRIVMLGAGYVGLVSGACFAEFGVDVTCVDPDERKLSRLRDGVMPIYEPGLDDLVARNVAAGRLSFASGLPECEAGPDAVFIAVGTPSRRGDGHADLTHVYQAARDTAAYLTPDHFTVVVTKSTVPVGTAREVGRIIREANPSARFATASNPEFLREGSAIGDFMRPDRVVFGTDSEEAVSFLRALYRPLYLLDTPIVQTTLETAELTKYASNAFLATKVTFINEMADLCERVGANVQDVARGIGLDGRIGRKFLHAGPGYGGSCFPKDTLALIETAKRAGSPVRIVETVVDINNRRKRSMASRVIAAAGGDVRGKTVAVLGVSFKPNTDDMRESVALDVIPALQAAGAVVQAFDPAAMEEAGRLLPGVTWAEDAYGALNGACVAVILTEWNEFRGLNFRRAGQLMERPILVDLRNIYKTEEMAKTGFAYYSIGRAIENGVPGEKRNPDGHE